MVVSKYGRGTHNCVVGLCAVVPDCSAAEMICHARVSQFAHGFVQIACWPDIGSALESGGGVSAIHIRARIAPKVNTTGTGSVTLILNVQSRATPSLRHTTRVRYLPIAPMVVHSSADHVCPLSFE
jgi:hypothetical protein